jgi:hypothetical protein
MIDNSQTSLQQHPHAFYLILVVSFIGLAVGIAYNPLVGFLLLAVGILAAAFIRKFGILHLVVALVFLELILGGSGRVYEFTSFFSVRKVLFILTWILFLLLGASDPQRFVIWFRSASFARRASLIGVATFIFFGLGVGLYRGNRPDYIINDASGFTFITLSLPIGYFARIGKMKLEFLLGVALGASALFGLIKGIVFSGAQLGYFDFSYVIDLLQNEARQAVSVRTTTGMVRLATVGDIFFVFALPLCVAIGVSTKRWRTRWMAFAGTGALIWGLFASGSRGCWLGSLIGVSVLFALAKLQHKLKIFALVIIGAVVVLQLFPTTIGTTSEWITLAFSSREYNNLARVEQARILIDAGLEHPIIGNGFGHTLPNLVRSYENPYAFELETLAFFMKMGILGCAIWLAFFAWLLNNLLKLSQRLPDPVHAMIARGLCGGLVSLVAASSANPYISGAPGMGILALTAVSADLFLRQVAAARIEGAKVASPASMVRFARVPRFTPRQASRPTKY